MPTQERPRRIGISDRRVCVPCAITFAPARSQFAGSEVDRSTLGRAIIS